MRMMIILESDAGILGKKKSECSYQESNIIFINIYQAAEIVIYKLKVEKRTIKTYLQFIPISRLIFKHKLFKRKYKCHDNNNKNNKNNISINIFQTIYKLKVPIPKKKGKKYNSQKINGHTLGQRLGDSHR